ncbi:uncharacterized protein LOC120422169 [Culex pipiens pallens]|uniref:uncharacterized protein LOC120422169 n=1 Tax=Culex pipiens pallens TaxID=42434 RepID=UPI001953ADFF|nr:uncharacterized protein LOC120422169 [Culex pipiens pallens]
MSSSSLIRPGLTTAILGQLPAIKLRLRKKVPLLTFREVRRARIPLYEAFASELYESGHVNGAFLMLQLIEFEHDHVPRTSQQTIEDRRLKNSKNLLNFLFKTLREAESYKIAQNYEAEVEHLLMIARSFLDDSQKRWISRQFFLIVLDRCADCRLCELQIGALMRYHYGMFLLEEKKLDEAIEQLELARDLSTGQVWKLEKDQDFGSPLMINEIQHQLYLVYSKMCERFKKTDPDRYELYLRLSHKAAVESNLEHVACDSYLNFGDFLLDQGEYRDALECYKNSFKRAKSTYAEDKVCKTHIRMAAAYRRLNELTECNFMLNLVDKLSAKDHHTECYAEYQVLIGEIHFENGRLDEARQAFHRAREVYKVLKKEDRMVQACIFGALAHGETHFGLYANLVKKAEVRGLVSDNENLFKLLRFNVDNDPFWCDRKCSTMTSSQ